MTGTYKISKEAIYKWREANRQAYNEYMRLWRQKNKSKVSEHNKNQRYKNADALAKYQKEWREKNKEHVVEYRKQHCHKNQDAISTKRKKYYELNRGRIREKAKAYYQLNKTRAQEKARIYHAINKDKRKIYKSKYKPARNKIRRERRISDPLFALSCNLRAQLYNYLKKGGLKKDKRTEEIIGIDFGTVKRFIERQFENGMSWNNYGQWHLDHKMPLASAKDEQELIGLFHFSNLQPLWALENLKKGAKQFNHQIKLRL